MEHYLVITHDFGRLDGFMTNHLCSDSAEGRNCGVQSQGVETPPQIQTAELKMFKDICLLY